MFERRKLVLQEKISIENERFKSFTKFRNKKAAVECLKRKSFYESQLEQLEHLQSQIKDQIRAINGLT
ncbi:Snf7 [Thalictrum thalictroides]|uniref:Snf7 n=1 Tax=Thalictrum thalictroides TaxID=46969 RepID=A0A7J6WJ69_THATH|nr:Snf7 [Thalictrum thalictroides]